MLSTASTNSEGPSAETVALYHVKVTDWPKRYCDEILLRDDVVLGTPETLNFSLR